MSSFSLSDDFIAASEALTKGLDIVASNEDVLFNDRVKAIMAGMISLILLLLKQLVDDSDYSDFSAFRRAEQITRINKHLIILESSLHKKREFENKEDVDLNHPKFQIALDFVVGEFLSRMDSVGVNVQGRDSVMHELNRKIEGFENNMNKKINRASFSKLPLITTPQVIDFNKKRSFGDKGGVTVPQELKELKELKELMDSDDFKVDVETLTESIRIVESNEEVLFGERLNAIMAGMISLFPLLLEELADECSDFSRSDQATRVNRHLVSLQKALYKSSRANKNKKDVDFNHPKFQAGLDHVVDAFVETMESVGIKEKDRDSVMHELSQKMRGFEVKMNKLLKGVPFSELDSVKTPF